MGRRSRHWWDNFEIKSSASASSSSSSRRRTALAASVLVLSLIVGVAFASAQKSAVNVFGSTGEGDGELSNPRDIAVNESSDEIYVVEDSNHRISVFDADGEFVEHIGEEGTGAGQFDNPQGIAIDQDTGDLFVTDRDNRRIQRFDSDGNFVMMWGWGVDDGHSAEAQVCMVACSAGIAGSGAGQLGSGSAQLRIDVSKPDAVTDNVQVFVADPSNRRVQEFTPDDGGFDGTPADTFGVAGSNLGEFGNNQPLHVAVDADGIVYASDSNSSNRVQRYDTNTDAFRPAIDVAGISGTSSTATSGLEVDATTDSLYVSRSSSVGILEFELPADPDDPPTHSAESPHGTNVSTTAQGLGLNEGLSTLYKSTGSSGPWRVQIIRESVAPVATIAPATAIEATTATFNGTVDPNGGLTEYYFEYSDNAGANWTGHKALSAGAGTDPVAVERTPFVGSLKPNTEHLVRLVAENVFTGETDTTANETFTTDPAAPAVNTFYANKLKTDQATLVGRVNPNSEAATYWFEWGETDGYGNFAPAAQDGDAGAGGDGVVVSEDITGLDPETTYHFRVVAQNASGLTEGPDETFETPAEECPNADIRSQQNAGHLPDCRAYEQVSPIDKNGNHVGIGGVYTGRGALASADGDRALYSSAGAFPGSVAGGAVGVYSGARDADSWQTLFFSPPFTPQGDSIAYGRVHGVTPDLSKQVVMTFDALAPGAVFGNHNVYIHDSADDSYELMTTGPSGFQTQQRVFLGRASDDGLRYVFDAQGDVDSTPPPPAGNLRRVYEFSGGELKLLGILPDGSIAPESRLAAGSCEPMQGGGGVCSNGVQVERIARNAVSADGARVYFDARAGSFAPLYLREGNQTTLVTERESDGTTQDGVFQHATPSGEYAFLLSEDQLTDDASPAGWDLYRYDADADELTNLTPTGTEAGVEGVLGVSENGSHVYFQATGALAPGATEGEHNIYAWHDGEIRLIATSSSGLDNIVGAIGRPPDAFGVQDNWQVSPDGDYVGILMDGALSGPNPQPDPGTKQAYLYDFAADSLACASCPPGGATSTADARFQEGLGPGLYGGSQEAVAEGMQHFVLDDGGLFFSSPDSLVSGDTNGKLDVYKYRAGEAHLISTGQSPEDSFLGDVTADGAAAFILTQNQLVGQDQDEFYDYYSARVNGGLESQNPADEPECEGDECQGEQSSQPEDDEPGTGGSGAGNPDIEPSCDPQQAKVDRYSDRIKKLRSKKKQARQKAKIASGKKAKRSRKRAKRIGKKVKKVRSKKRDAKRDLRSCREAK